MIKYVPKEKGGEGSVKKTGELDIRGTLVRVVKINGEDYVSLTDMAKLKSEDAQQTISKAYESINLIGMTDADAIKCRKLASIHQQITNAIKQNVR